MRVVATAGHVDHGKSSLVQALTGTDPDRLVEEKRRGLTIDLGFAHTTVDGCLFVVDAGEGWKPQSEEHLRILELLGVVNGLVALTKVDLLGDPELVELATLDVAEHIEGTFL